MPLIEYNALEIAGRQITIDQPRSLHYYGGMKNGNHAKREREEISSRRLAQVAREASATAIRESFALGLPITVLEGSAIIEIFPDGRKKLIKELSLKSRPNKKPHSFRIK